MGAWEYKLLEGKKLRSLINNESSSSEIFNQIKVCCESMLRILNEDDLFSFEDDIENIIAQVDYLVSEEDYGESAVNDLLEEFYDLCDNCRCWIEI